MEGCGKRYARLREIQNTNEMKSDLTYYYAGGFLRFVPNTPEGQDAWREMAKASEGTAAFPPRMKASIFRQLKEAGLTVKKNSPVKKTLTSEEAGKLLSELGL